jgi:hypothetical protein
VNGRVGKIERYIGVINSDKVTEKKMDEHGKIKVNGRIGKINFSTSLENIH